MLWDNRLGHMSEKGIKLLHSKQFIPSLECVNMDFCESCAWKTKESEFCEKWEGKER